MSIRIMTAVFDHSEARLADRLVLLVIADRCNDDGAGCWRGRESIAEMARVSPRQVTRSIERLRELGELEVTERAGQTHLYRVTLDRLATPPGQIGQPTLDNLATDTSLEPSSESRRKRRPPRDFQPTEEHQEYARAHGLVIENERERWLAWCEAQGKTYAKLNAGFTTWLHRAVDFNRGDKAAARPRGFWEGGPPPAYVSRGWPRTPADDDEEDE